MTDTSYSHRDTDIWVSSVHTTERKDPEHKRVRPTPFPSPPLAVTQPKVTEKLEWVSTLKYISVFPNWPAAFWTLKTLAEKSNFYALFVCMHVCVPRRESIGTC